MNMDDFRSAMKYLIVDGVTDVKRTPTPKGGANSMGYGNKTPTQWMVKYQGRWRRVYAICWSNAATCYVRCGKDNVYLGSFDPHYWECKRLESGGRSH